MRLTDRPSLTWRLTLLFAAASSLVLLTLGLVIGSSVDSHFEEQDLDVLSGKMAQIQQALAQANSPAELTQLIRGLEASLAKEHELALIVLGPTQTLVRSAPLADFPLTHSLGAVQDHGAPAQPITWSQNRQSYRLLVSTLQTGVDEPSQLTVAVAINIAHHRVFMQSFLRTLWLFVAAAAVLTGVLGWAVARRGLVPLRAMGEQANRVSAQQLSHRLALQAAPLELVELAQSLNAMLDRLEDSFRRLSDFSSDLAHELRTPINTLMTQTQVALSRARDADGYRNVLESNTEEFERVSRMIADMLLLAKADNGLVVPNREPLQLSAEVRALFDYYEALAEDKELQLICVGEAELDGDRSMLRRALGNLLSNAVRHAIAGGAIRFELSREDAGTVGIAVQSTGDPIAPEHQERIFDRFFRIDPSRQRSSDGSGLGLAIAKSMIVAHGGTIMVRCAGALNTFVIQIPCSRQTTAQRP